MSRKGNCRDNAVVESFFSSLKMETGASPNNAAVRLHRARKALKKQLQVSCGTCASHGCLDCTCSEKGAERKAEGCGTAKA